MTDAPSVLADLLADCDAHGVRLALADGGGLGIDAPQVALTPDLLARLKGHKGELLAMLRPVPDVAPALPAVMGDDPAKPAKASCHCGSTTWRDFPIHGGQSVRRDCGRCGKFLAFPVWYGTQLEGTCNSD